MNIFELPLYYISFERNSDIEKMYSDYGFKNINHFEAIRGSNFDIDQMFNQNMLSIRSYFEIKSGDRKDHWGMTGLGSIGCALSHYTVWQKCIDYIIIAEDDNAFTTSFTPDLIQRIQQSLVSAPKSIFISSSIRSVGYIKRAFFGSNFYIISKALCEALTSHFYPIDVQVDFYISMYCNIDPDVVLTGENIAQQTRGLKASSVQTKACIPCNLPAGNKPYVIFFVVVLFSLISISVLFYVIKIRACLSKRV